MISTSQPDVLSPITKTLLEKFQYSLGEDIVDMSVLPAPTSSGSELLVLPPITHSSTSQNEAECDSMAKSNQIGTISIQFQNRSKPPLLAPSCSQRTMVVSTSLDSGLRQFRGLKLTSTEQQQKRGRPKDRRGAAAGSKASGGDTGKQVDTSLIRKARIAQVDHEAMRKLAEDRALHASRAAAEQAKKANEIALAKRKDVSDRRKKEADDRVQRRAEIYAQNAIMKEMFRRERRQAEKEFQDASKKQQSSRLSVGGDGEEGGGEGFNEASTRTTCDGADAEEGEEEKEEEGEWVCSTTGNGSGGGGEIEIASSTDIIDSDTEDGDTGFPRRRKMGDPP